MRLDPKKVNLTEADIEEYLWQNPRLVTFADVWGNHFRIEKWLKRQFAIPSGILDLLGVTAGGTFVVVEVKNVEVDARAITQVSRYAYDMQNIAARANNRITCFPMKVIVGPAISTTAFRECESCEVAFVQFVPKLHLDMGQFTWTEKYGARRESDWERLAQDDDLRLDTSQLLRPAPHSPAAEEATAEDGTTIASAIEEYLANDLNEGEER